MTTIDRMSTRQMKLLAIAVLEESGQKARAGFRPKTIDGESIAAQLTFGWIDHLSDYCRQYGRQNRKPVLAMIRRGLVAFAAAWEIDHPALREAVMDLITTQRQASQAAQATKIRYEQILACMTSEEAARWEELQARLSEMHGKARKRIKAKQGDLFQRVSERLSGM